MPAKEGGLPRGVSALHIETSFLVYRYIFTISSLSIKVIGLRSRS